MSIKDWILKDKGKWLFTYKDNSKWILDFDNMTFDTYNWYKAYGVLENEITDIDDWFKNVVSCKKIN